MCMNTSPDVHERLKLLRLLGTDFFFNQIALYHDVMQGDNCCILKTKRHRTGNLKEDLFPSHPQLPLDKKFRRPCFLLF